MAYAGILPEVPSFGQSFARNLGAGVSQGVGAATNFAQQMAMEKYKTEKRGKLVSDIHGRRENGGQNPMEFSEKFAKEFIDQLPEIEQALERDLTPDDLDKLWQGYSQNAQKSQAQEPYDYLREAEDFAAAGEHDLSRVSIEKSKRQERQSLQKGKQEFQREQKSEEKLDEINNHLMEEERQDMRFGRLEELYSPEFEEKFPSNIMAAVLSKDGELRPTAMALLSEEAQEAIKLTYDQLTGAKETFGGRVTNFDVQSYLKRHPGLFNTPEGRRRVLRDLKIMNQLNKLHDSEVLNIVDEFGGPGKISMSKANTLFRKRFADQIHDLKEEFINPNKKKFEQLPEASRYNGKMAIDEETGQKFRSNGKEWVPE